MSVPHANLQRDERDSFPRHAFELFDSGNPRHLTLNSLGDEALDLRRSDVRVRRVNHEARVRHVGKQVDGEPAERNDPEHADGQKEHCHGDGTSDAIAGNRHGYSDYGLTDMPTTSSSATSAAAHLPCADSASRSAAAACVTTCCSCV